MSGRFENIALVILIAGTVVACIAIAQEVGEQDERYYSARPRADQEIASNPVAPLKNRRPAADRSICRESETEKEYELCQAWRSANAAEEAASTAWLQIILSLGALVGLYFTVRYTAQSARAASNAAIQMSREIDIQLRVEKPFLTVARTVKDYSLPNQLIVMIGNNGKTAATLLDYSLECAVGVDGLTGQPAYRQPTSKNNELLERGTEAMLMTFIPGQGLLPVMQDDASAVAWGYVRYEDIFGRIWRRGFGVKHMVVILESEDGTEEDREEWVREGGDAYNYDREEKTEK